MFTPGDSRVFQAKVFVVVILSPDKKITVFLHATDTLALAGRFAYQRLAERQSGVTCLCSSA